MTNRELLCELGYEDSVIFDNPDFDDAIIGVTTDGNVVYDYDKMVVSLAEKDGMDLADAADFIDYNTIRSLPYVGESAPIIMYGLNQED